MDRLVDFRISLNGSPLDQSINREVISLSCELSTLMASEMTVLLNDPAHAIAGSDYFKLGEQIKLFLFSGNEEYSVMTGRITSREPQFTLKSTATLLIRAYDHSFPMRRNTPARPPFLNVKDSDIVNEIVNEYGLTAQVEETKVVHEYVQQIGTDWGFLEQRARINGFDIWVDQDKLFFKKRPWQQESDHILTAGENLLEMRLRQSIAEQESNHIVRAWDPVQKQPLVARANSSSIEMLNGTTTGAEVLEKTMGPSRSLTFDQPLLTASELEYLAIAELNRKVRRYISGEGLCVGIPELFPGQMVNITAMGEMFSGLYFVSQLKHVIDSIGFFTQINVEKNSQ